MPRNKAIPARFDTTTVDCRICHTAVMKQNIVPHAAQHTPQVYRCGVCDKRFRSIPQCRQHTWQRHAQHMEPENVTGTAEYLRMIGDKLDVCFPTDRQKDHLAVMKTCRTCHKKIRVQCDRHRAKQAMNSHALMHMEKRWKCRICDRRFRKMSYVQTHIKEKHPRQENGRAKYWEPKLTVSVEEYEVTKDLTREMCFGI